MPALILLISPSCGGKTTWALNYIKTHNNVIRLCPDNLRGLYSKDGDESDQTNNGIIFKNLGIFTEHLMSQKIWDLIIDATNVSIKNRKMFVDLARKYNFLIKCFVFRTPIEVCVERNEKRARKVPFDVISRQFQNLEIPLPHEVDYIEYINYNGEMTETEEISIFDESYRSKLPLPYEILQEPVKIRKEYLD